MADLVRLVKTVLQAAEIVADVLRDAVVEADQADGVGRVAAAADADLAVVVVAGAGSRRAT
jgi:hypothetical protein